MGTRLYLTNVAAGYTPPTIRGAWSDKALTGASKMITRKTGAGVTAAKAETSTSSAWKTLLRRFVSDPINNGALINGSLLACFGALESNVAANMSLVIYTYVTVGDTDVMRGDLLAGGAGGGGEWPDPKLGAQGVLILVDPLDPVTALPGDRIVVELGYQAQNTVSTSYTGTLYYGGLGTDMAKANSGVTTRPGWVEFGGAGVAAAFAPPTRVGATVTATGPISTAPIGRKVGRAATVSATGPVSTLVVSRRKMHTVSATGPVSMVTASRTQTVATVTAPSILTPCEAVHLSGGAATVTNVDPTILSYTRVTGAIDLAPPTFDLLPIAQRPRVSHPLRFIAQDIRTGRFRDWELPLVDPEIVYTLSGPTIIRAGLNPEYTLFKDTGIEPWATWVHVEEDGQILASGIWQPAEVNDESYAMEAVGPAGYANDMPFWGEELLLETDACDVVRIIWRHLQSYPDAQLGVEISQDKCGLILGVPAHQGVDPETGELEYDETTTPAPTPPTDTSSSGGSGGSSGDYSADEGAYDSRTVFTTHHQLGARTPDSMGPSTYGPDDVAYHPGRPSSSGTDPTTDPATPEPPHAVSQVEDPTTGVITVEMSDGSTVVRTPRIVEAAPYKLCWYEDIDCGREIDNLAKTALFDYVESAGWNDDRTQVTHRIQLGYPRVGKRRFDLRCALDENLLIGFPLREEPGMYAGQIMTRGKGEGRDAIRGYAGASDPRRVRRVAIVTDQTLLAASQADANSRDELGRRRAAVTIGELVIDADHPNMPIGSYAVGDEILVSARLPYAGYIELWHRIISYSWRPDAGQVTLQVRRAEQFQYGRSLLGQPDGSLPNADTVGGFGEDDQTPLPGTVWYASDDATPGTEVLRR